MSDGLSVSIPHLGTFPLSMLDSFAGLWPLVTKGITAGKSPEEIEAELKAVAVPAVLEFAESALNIIFPGAGTLLEAVAWLVDNSKGSAGVKTIQGYGPDGRLIEISNPDYKGD